MPGQFTSFMKMGFAEEKERKREFIKYKRKTTRNKWCQHNESLFILFLKIWVRITVKKSILENRSPFPPV